MLNNLFIDTDVILDILLDRKEFFDDSAAVFQKFENGEVLLFTSTSIIINAQYVGQKQIGKDECRFAINYLLSYFLIMEATTALVKKAYKSKFVDIEDAIQYYSATQNESIDYFITRNTKDFRAGESRMSVVTPSQFLKIFKQIS
ncbi:MAG: PIN domain-containing protein [Ginsengibacter sp.]